MTHRYSTGSVTTAQPAKSGYGFLAAVLDTMDDQPLLDDIQAGRINGRPGYPVRSMWRAWLCKYILSIRYNVELVERLHNSRKLRQLCGFEQVPSESTFCRFFNRLTHFQDRVDKILINITAKISAYLPNFGKVLAADSTVYETYGNPDRKTVSGDPRGDMDAAWGYKHSSRAKGVDKVEYCFGYKVHAVADALYEIPLGFILTPANKNDNPLLPDIVNKVQQDHSWLKPAALIADRGYDSERNHRFLRDRQISPVIHLRKPAGIPDSPLHQGLYTLEGQPHCVGNLPMEYVKTDSKTGQHLFRCQEGGCPLQDRRGVRYCDSEVWEDPEEKPRILGTLARANPLWKKLYKLRWSIERIFGSAKRNRNLDQHCFRGFRKNLLHATLSMLTYSATALAYLEAGDGRRMRHMRIAIA